MQIGRDVRLLLSIVGPSDTAYSAPITRRYGTLSFSYARYLVRTNISETTTAWEAAVPRARSGGLGVRADPTDPLAQDGGSARRPGSVTLFERKRHLLYRGRTCDPLGFSQRELLPSDEQILASSGMLGSLVAPGCLSTGHDLFPGNNARTARTPPCRPKSLTDGGGRICSSTEHMCGVHLRLPPLADPRIIIFGDVVRHPWTYVSWCESANLWRVTSVCDSRKPSPYHSSASCVLSEMHRVFKFSVEALMRLEMLRAQLGIPVYCITH